MQDLGRSLVQMHAAMRMFLIAAALLATNAASVAAKDFEPVGGAGTNAGEFRDHCPPNTFLVVSR